MEELVSGLCSALRGDSTQHDSPLSSEYRSPVCQQLRPSCNPPSWNPFRAPSWRTPVVIRLGGELNVSHDDWQTRSESLLLSCGFSLHWICPWKRELLPCAVCSNHPAVSRAPSTWGAMQKIIPINKELFVLEIVKPQNCRTSFQPEKAP